MKMVGVVIYFLGALALGIHQNINNVPVNPLNACLTVAAVAGLTFGIVIMTQGF